MIYVCRNSWLDDLDKKTLYFGTEDMCFVAVTALMKNRHRLKAVGSFIGKHGWIRWYVIYRRT